MPVTAGGINRHLHISSSILSNEISLDEDASNHGYFIGLLNQARDIEEEEADAVPGNLEDWKGDQVEIYVEDGHVWTDLGNMGGNVMQMQQAHYRGFNALHSHSHFFIMASATISECCYANLLDLAM